MAKNSKPARSQAKYYVPTSIQKLFSLTLLILFGLSLVPIVISSISLVQSGSDFLPQLSYVFISYGVPIVIFSLAYVLNPRGLNVLSRVFESLLITVSSFIGWVGIGMVIPSIMMTLPQLSSPEAYFIVEYVTSAVYVAVMVSILLALRIKGVWK